MKKNDVPQDKVSTYAGHSKLFYAVDEQGNYARVQSTGWEVESAATRDALSLIDQDRFAAWERGKRGATSPLEFHMYDRRMDTGLLAQAVGTFQWRVRRHFRPEIFARLSTSMLCRYGEALGLSLEELTTLPEKPPRD